MSPNPGPHFCSFSHHHPSSFLPLQGPAVLGAPYCHHPCADPTRWCKLTVCLPVRFSSPREQRGDVSPENTAHHGLSRQDSRLPFQHRTHPSAPRCVGPLGSLFPVPGPGQVAQLPTCCCFPLRPPLDLASRGIPPTPGFMPSEPRTPAGL